ncbi:MAG TPA: M17 family peptidase N-terminal domain-containing protein, partial [Solirubrobacteraceae bacterium]|nr:M17 family peptidase N-terminal domain-containing protein [Solirubrobacteraceae bacterium]
MLVEATVEDPLATDADTVVVGHFEDEPTPNLDGALGALVASGEASPEFGRLAVTHSEGRRLILVGLGKRPAFGPEPARRAAATAQGRAAGLSAKVLCWSVPKDDPEVARALVEGTLLRAYRFDRYKPADNGTAIERLILASRADHAQLAHDTAAIVAAQNRAR